MSNHYEILGISRSASDKDIKTAYRRKAKQWHPDRHGNSEQSKQMFQQVGAAFEVLSDANKRRAYDQSLLFQQPQRGTQTGYTQQTGARTPPPRQNPYEAYDWQRAASGNSRAKEETFSSKSLEMYHAKIRLGRIKDSFQYYKRRKSLFNLAAGIASIQYNFPFYLLRHAFAGAAERTERRKAFNIVSRWHDMNQSDQALGQRIDKLQSQFNEIERNRKGLRYDVAKRVMTEMENELHLRHNTMDNCLNVIRGREKHLHFALG